MNKKNDSVDLVLDLVKIAIIVLIGFIIIKALLGVA